MFYVTFDKKQLNFICSVTDDPCFNRLNKDRLRVKIFIWDKLYSITYTTSIISTQIVKDLNGNTLIKICNISSIRNLQPI